MHNSEKSYRTSSEHGYEDHLPGIICDVTNCVYNNQRKECTAPAIKVGPQYANSSDDTVCVTFRP